MLFSNFSGWAPQCSGMCTKARAIHFKDCTALRPSQDTFSGTEWLRVLDLSGLENEELPESMRNLHHLQVLNLSENTCLTKLHSSICGSKKLHYLNLHGCSSLRELPDSIHDAEELMYLDLSDCTSLRELPAKAGGLQKLSCLNLSGCSKLEKIPDIFGCLKNLKDLNMSFCSRLRQLPGGFFKDMKEIRFLNMSYCDSLEELPELGGNNEGRLLEMLDLSGCAKLSGLHGSYGFLSELRYLNLSGCSKFRNIMVFLPQCKFVKLEYLNLSGVGPEGNPGASTTSSGRRSQDHSEELLPISVLREEIIESMICLKYLSVGGYTLFSEQGIASLMDLQTLPFFRVRQLGDDNRSNIDLIGKILDATQRKLCIECLENVMAPEEVDNVGIGNKQIHSLSLEWSSYISYFECNPREILEKLRPHRDLQDLIIQGYTEDTFPDWIMRINDTLPNLVKIVLINLNNCSDLPTLGNKLEEVEIRNAPSLREVRIGPCRKLRRLSLIAIGSGATLKLTDGNERKEQRHTTPDTELGSAPKIKGTTSKRLFQQTRKFFKRSSKAAEPSEQSNTMPSAWQQTSPSLYSGGSSEEADVAEFPVLDYLHIESCQDMIFYPGIPKSARYHISTDSPHPQSSAFTSEIDNSGFQGLQCIDIVGINSDNIDTPTCEGFGRLEDFYLNSGDLGCFRKVKYAGYYNRQGIFFVKPMNGEPNCSLSNIALLHQYLDDEECYGLTIKNIDNVRSHEDFSEGLIRNKYWLLSLSLDWCHTSPTAGHSTAETLKAIMDKLQPPQNLRVLRIKGYRGAPLWSWMMNIASVLPHLEELELAQLSELTTIPEAIESCRFLHKLAIVDCWNFAVVPEWLGKLEYLHELTLYAANLTCLPPCIKSMTRLRSLVLQRCNHKLRQRCLSGKDKEKIQHIPYIDTYEVMTFSVKPTNEQGSSYSSNLPLLFDGRGWECDKLIIENLENVKSDEENLENVKSDEEVSQDELNRCYSQLLSLILKWSVCSYFSDSSVVEDALVLEKLQPPKRIGMVRVEGYRGATFGPSSWMMKMSSLLPHLIKIELAHMKMCEHLPPLGQLANLEELHISFMPSITMVDTDFYGGSSPFVKLRKLILDSMENLVEWANACACNGEDEQQQQETDRIFPHLQTLVIKNCPRLGSPLTESESLSIRKCSEVLSMPDFIRCCKCLQELVIVDSWNFADVPEWLGELTCLEELTLDAAKVLRLPLCIKPMISIKKLTLNKCNYQLRQRCNSGEDKYKVEHINHIKTDQEPNFAVSSIGIMDFQKITPSQLIEINIQLLEQINQEAAAKLNLSAKDQLRYLRLEWTSSRAGSVVEDKAVLENLQPHHTLQRLCIRNYSGDIFPSWISLLPNLLRLELDGLQFGYLPLLDQLPNLDKLIISNMRPTSTIDLYICTTQPHKKLRSIVLSGLQDVNLRTSLQEQDTCYEDKFPNLHLLEIRKCGRLRSQPSIPRSERYIILETLLGEGLRFPSVQRVMYPSTSSASSKLEIKESDFSRPQPADIWESLRHANISELTMNDIQNREAMVQSIVGWESLRKLEILGHCSYIKEVPAHLWQGNTFLQELRLETAMTTLPTYIQKLRALQTLSLLNVCSELAEKCSPTGQERMKIAHVPNVHIESTNLHDQ